MIRERPIRGEGHEDFLGESEGSLPQPQDSLPDAGEAINDFWSMSGNFIYRHHVEAMLRVLGRWHRLLHMWTPSCRIIQLKTRSTSRPCWISSLSRTFTSGRTDHTVTGTGRKKVLENTILQNNSKRSEGNEDTRTFPIVLFGTHGSEKPCWN